MRRFFEVGLEGRLLRLEGRLLRLEGRLLRLHLRLMQSGENVAMDRVRR